MLRVSKLADYGTVIMASLARDPLRVHSAAELALRIGLAEPTVSKVLKTLARSGLVSSSRGVKGGYRLPRAPADITVAQIVDAMDGPIGVTECSGVHSLCPQESACGVRSSWRSINHLVLETLSRVTLEQMAQSTQSTTQAVPLATIARRPARTTTTA